MTYHTEAIYEGGVFRPFVPLNLKEQEVVSLAISTPAESNPLQEEPARQRSILAAYLAKVESQPDETPQDGLTNRDHDRLIYEK